MSPFPSLERIIVVPRNGYANRLQAWASATILAAQLDVAIRVLWEPETVAPTLAANLFSTQLTSRTFLDREEFLSVVGKPHGGLPRYLTVDVEHRTVVLAGHDLGEQVFMPELIRTLAHPCKPHTLVLIAGGKFFLASEEDFVRQRFLFYQGLSWSNALNERVSEALSPRGEYAGLHIRETDRSLEAPTPKTIRHGLGLLRDRLGGGELFIAADTARGRDRWSAEATQLGFTPWTLEGAQHDRTHPDAGLDAMADWRILGLATALVYPAASTYSEEASVASGRHDLSIPLVASPSLQRARRWTNLGRSALTYPRRRYARKEA